MILITGANGHIGSFVVSEFIRSGYTVRAFCRKGSDRRGLRDLPEDSFSIAEGDILDAESLELAMQGCDGVVHMAALFSNDPLKRKEIFTACVDGTLNVLKAAKRSGIKRIVYTSTTAALGSSTDPAADLDETSWVTGTATPYIDAKTEAERAASRYSGENGLELIVVLPSVVIGENDYRLTSSNSLIKKLSRPGSIFYCDGGVNLVHARDVAVGHLLAYEKGRRLERYILSGWNISYGELARKIDSFTGKKTLRLNIPFLCLLGAGAAFDAIGAVTGKKMPVSLGGVRASVGRYFYATNKKAKAELGFAPSPVDETIKKALEWVSGER